MRGKSVVVGLLLLSTMVATTPGAAEAERSGTWTVTGKCKRLIVRNEKLTEACTGEVTQTRNADGTVTFRFSDGRNWLLFRGKQATIRLLRGYKTYVDLDGVAFGKIDAEPLFQELASAACNYSAPYRGEAYISCSAILNFQLWAATIETDGRLPIPDNEYIQPTLSAP